MLQLIEHAREHFSVLRLHTSNPVAARLYESLGFRPASQGRETHRLRI
jgi:predicted GNAT family acetyltransferase